MVNAAHLTAIMLKRLTGSEGLAEILADIRFNAVLIGPGAGVGPDTAEMVRVILSAVGAGAKRGAVIDADALTSFMHAPDALFEAIHAHGGQVVLTPHEGEFARIFPDLAERTGAPKLERARMAARRSGAVVILKGADTVIAEPGGKAAINDNAPPDLATAGSGDTLAGIVTGLIARSAPAFEAACAAVWMHGETGRIAGPGLIAEDLAGHLPAVLRGLYDLKTRLALQSPGINEDDGIDPGGSD
jgi:hydroxyethylthiazole kinase-like uncharacterized protein yjeF